MRLKQRKLFGSALAISSITRGVISLPLKAKTIGKDEYLSRKTQQFIFVRKEVNVASSDLGRGWRGRETPVLSLF